MSALHWWAQRLSGLLLVVFAGIHVATQYALLPFALAGAPRVAVNGGLLLLVVYHGVVGLTTIVDDYARRPGTRRVLHGVLWAGGAALLVYGAAGLGAVPP